MSAVEVPDQRINSAIPEAKQRIRVEGVTAILTVEKVEETSLLDGVGKPVYNIFVKGPNGAITAMLERRYKRNSTSSTTKPVMPRFHCPLTARPGLKLTMLSIAVVACVSGFQQHGTTEL